MAAVAVRTSLEKGCLICLREMRKHNVTVIVGFSWPGAVLAELLVQGHVGMIEDDQPAALLIAPIKRTTLNSYISSKKKSVKLTTKSTSLTHVLGDC